MHAGGRRPTYRMPSTLLARDLSSPLHAALCRPSVQLCSALPCPASLPLQQLIRSPCLLASSKPLPCQSTSHCVTARLTASNCRPSVRSSAPTKTRTVWSPSQKRPNNLRRARSSAAPILDHHGRLTCHHPSLAHAGPPLPIGASRALPSHVACKAVPSSTLPPSPLHPHAPSPPHLRCRRLQPSNELAPLAAVLAD
jgi:hypothetical protein